MPELDLNKIGDEDQEKTPQKEEIEKNFEENNEVIEEVKEDELDEEEGLEGNEPIEIHLGPVTKLVNRTLDQALEMEPDPEFDKQTEQIVDAIAEQHEMYALAKPEVQLLVLYGMRYGPKLLGKLFEKISRKKQKIQTSGPAQKTVKNLYNFD